LQDEQSRWLHHAGLSVDSSADLPVDEQISVLAQPAALQGRTHAADFDFSFKSLTP
jgi:hypothetical protein